MLPLRSKHFGFLHCMTMTLSERSCDRLRFQPLLARCAAALVLAIFVFAESTTVEASIVGPAVPEFCLEQPSGVIRDGRASRSGVPSEQQTAKDSARQVEFSLLSAQQGTSNSSSSTSGSSSLGGAGASMALAPLSANGLSGSAVVGWVPSERQVSLPAPPGNELLKPPQSCA